VFTKNRDRLLEADVAREFLATLLALPQVKRLLSSDRSSVDGTLIEAWASKKSFRAKDGSGEPSADGRNGKRNFRREKRSNETHQSTTDPDARPLVESTATSPMTMPRSPSKVMTRWTQFQAADSRTQRRRNPKLRNQISSRRRRIDLKAQRW
jgi:hypothetical protein